jgi:hypothetical protein
MDQNVPKMWANLPVYGDIFIAPEGGQIGHLRHVDKNPRICSY